MTLWTFDMLRARYMHWRYTEGRDSIQWGAYEFFTLSPRLLWPGLKLWADQQGLFKRGDTAVAILTVENMLQLCEHNLARAKASTAKGDVADAAMFAKELSSVAVTLAHRLEEVRVEGAQA